MEDLKRSSSCHNFTSEKAKRRQELNSSPLMKRAVRPTLSDSCSPRIAHHKLKATSAITFPVTVFQFKEDKEERLTRNSREYQVNFPERSKHNEAKIPINSGNFSRNTFINKQKLQQTPSIVINSPPSNGRAVSVTDITLDEPSTTPAENEGKFMAGRETDRGEFTHLNKEIPRSLQRQNKDKFAPIKERGAHSKSYHEKQQRNVYGYQIFTDKERENPEEYINRKVLSPSETHFGGNFRDVERHEARNMSPRTHNVDTRARNESPGARNLEQSSFDEERTDTMSSEFQQADNVTTSPSIFPERFDNPGNTDEFQRHRPIYIKQDTSDGLYQQKVQYLANHVSAKNSSKQANTPRQIPRQSQSESNLKTRRNSQERTVYPIIKTWSDPTSMQAGQSQTRDLENRNSNDHFSSVTSLSVNNSIGTERPLYSHGNKGNDASSASDRKGNTDFDTDRQLREANHTKGTFPSSTRHIFSANEKANVPTCGHANTEMPKKDVTETAKPRSEVFGGLLGEADANHSAEYYDRMISKINEQINLAVSRNKSPYAFYGLGSDDDDDWC